MRKRSTCLVPHVRRHSDGLWSPSNASNKHRSIGIEIGKNIMSCVCCNHCNTVIRSLAAWAKRAHTVNVNLCLCALCIKRHSPQYPDYITCHIGSSLTCLGTVCTYTLHMDEWRSCRLGRGWEGGGTGAGRCQIANTNQFAKYTQVHTYIIFIPQFHRAVSGSISSIFSQFVAVHRVQCSVHLSFHEARIVTYSSRFAWLMPFPIEFYAMPCHTIYLYPSEFDKIEWKCVYWHRIAWRNATARPVYDIRNGWLSASATIAIRRKKSIHGLTNSREHLIFEKKENDEKKNNSRSSFIGKSILVVRIVGILYALTKSAIKRLDWHLQNPEFISSRLCDGQQLASEQLP